MISLLQQLSFEIDLPVDVYCDSDGTISIASKNIDHKRTKHIDVKYHYIREKINEGTIRVNGVDSKDNLADILTKPLAREQHHTLTSKLGLFGAPTEGDCWKSDGG